MNRYMEECDVCGEYVMCHDVVDLDIAVCDECDTIDPVEAMDTDGIDYDTDLEEMMIKIRLSEMEDSNE